MKKVEKARYYWKRRLHTAIKYEWNDILKETKIGKNAFCGEIMSKNII